MTTNAEQQQLAAIVRTVVNEVLSSMHVPRVVWGNVTDLVPGPPYSTVTIQPPTSSNPDILTPDPIQGIRYESWYSPTVGDLVFGFTIGRDTWVGGTLAP
jgi:hypothetical protein